MTDLIERTDLAELLARSGAWTTAYVDAHGDGPSAAEEARLASLRDALAQTGAPDGDIDAVVSAAAEPGLPSPSSRYLLVHEGRVEIDESFAGPRLGPQVLQHGSVPRIVPLLRHTSGDIRYLVVETAREGANLRLERATQVGADLETDVEGQDYYLTKVRQGGWSQRRYQASAEETWNHNQSDVADAVDEIVRERRPQFVVVSGDVRARQILGEHVSAGTRELLVDVDAHTRAEGADDTALQEAIAATIEQQARAAVDSARDRAAAGDGAAGAHGTEAVVHALQQGQVETLLLDVELLEADDGLAALDDAPWVTTTDAEVSGAGEIGRVPLAEGLARAAVLTGAGVLLIERDEPADDEPLEERSPSEPIAVLRWPEDAPSAQG